MKKFGLFVAGGIAAIVLIANLGSIAGLAISLLVLYLIFRQFLKARSTAAKIGWGILGLICITAAFSNAPAIIGVAAAFVLYLVYKKWKETDQPVKEETDPFTNFEKQWSELHKNY